MRILHTADWHLGDRVGSRGVDRTRDLRRAVERVARYCADESVDVLIVAGDLFSDKLRHQDDLSDTILHLGQTFRPFLQRGGTILAVTGNHDKEVPCQTLKNTLTLADPADYPPGGLVRPGRFYLATGPSFFRLADPAGTEVQFLMMPYPTPARYLDGSGQAGATREEVNARLKAAYTQRLEQMMADSRYRNDLHTVLVAHIHALGASLRTTFRITDAEDVLFDSIPTMFAYVALGHIHIPQSLGGLDHVRYSGSIERLDLGERDDAKSVTLVEIGPAGRTGDVRLLPMDATPFYDVILDHPADEVPRLKAMYPDADAALVRYRLAWKPGEHDRDALVKQVEEAFPRWYDREFHQVGKSAEPTRHASLPADPVGEEQTALHFLEKELETDPDRDDILQLARELMAKS